MGSLLLYGAYGYTGRLVASEAVGRELEPIVAGRDAESVREQATALDVDSRVFPLDAPAEIATQLADVDAVVNCAGPFAQTAPPLVEACLETETDYLDITGEIGVFERLSRRDEDARDADVTVLPGVGFEVVPTDCLAAHLAEQLPDADELTLGINSQMTPSRGTIKTLLGQIGDDALVRRDGRLVPIALGSRGPEIDFGDGPEPTVIAPLGDLVTAAHSTGIDTVTTTVAIPGPDWLGRLAPEPSTAARFEPVIDGFAQLLDSRPAETVLGRAINLLPEGPDGRELTTSEAICWGEVRAGDHTERVLLRTPGPYALTAESAAAAAERALAGEASAGFQTPASAFGPDFVLDLARTERTGVELLPA
ncbi:saccharopine dehydrogenase NADP-binding domain-containing protein [Halobacteria archaeon AArc-dxtr1]|nr:saccharopine dehydrogenase NADP-binding domain-containing protein [Halobacteria archaeon AArc-dxtr1]